MFEVKRKVFLKWDGKSLEFDKKKSQLTLSELEFIYNGMGKHYYAMFKEEFDRLKYKGEKEKEWYEEFMKDIRRKSLQDTPDPK